MSSRERTSRRLATVDRKETPTSEGEDLSPSEDGLQSNNVTSSPTRPQTIQQEPNLQHMRSWIYILSLVVVFIAIIAYLAYSNKQSLDSRDQTIWKLRQEKNEYRSKVKDLQNELAQIKKEFSDKVKVVQDRAENQRKLDVLEAEKICAQEKYEATEKCRSYVDQVKEECRSDVDRAKEKYRSDMDEVKEKCRLGMDEAKEQYRSDLDQVKEKYRSDMLRTNETHRSDMDRAKELYREETEKRAKKIEQEMRLLEGDLNWFMDCLAGKNAGRNGNVFSTIFNGIWRAVKTVLGMNRDVEDCIEQFNDRFQRGLPA